MTLALVVRCLLACGFVVMGVLHFIRTEAFVYVMPPYIPFPVECVWLSGACEILGGIGTLVPATRPAAAWGLLALLVAVFPANIHMAVNNVVPPGYHVSQLALWLRLPLQAVLMYLVWWSSIATG